MLIGKKTFGLCCYTCVIGYHVSYDDHEKNTNLDHSTKTMFFFVKVRTHNKLHRTHDLQAFPCVLLKAQVSLLRR